MVDSQVILCPICGEYRHKSWFSVGRRGCEKCWHERRLWEPGTTRVYEVLADQERMMVKAVIARWIAEDTFPEEFTADERKIILLRTNDQKTPDEIGRLMKIKESRVRSIETRAQAKLIRLAREDFKRQVVAMN